MISPSFTMQRKSVRIILCHLGRNWSCYSWDITFYLKMGAGVAILCNFSPIPTKLFCTMLDVKFNRDMRSGCGYHPISSNLGLYHEVLARLVLGMFGWFSFRGLWEYMYTKHICGRGHAKVFKYLKSQVSLQYTIQNYSFLQFPYLNYF